MEKLFAVDVALLPSVAVMERLLGLIDYAPDSVIKLDPRSCLPHVTLAMGVIREGDIPLFGQVFSGFDREAGSIGIAAEQTRTYTLDNGKLMCEVSITVTPEVAEFRTRVSEAVRPLFLDKPATVDMFFAPPTVDPISTTWVLKYGETFRPHVTLGEGRVRSLEEPFEFAGAKLGLCQLGNYCTCRRELI